MTPEQYREVEERFSEALELSRSERELLLEKLGDRDTVVAEKLQALLAADERNRSFIEAPAAGAGLHSLLQRLELDSDAPLDTVPILPGTSAAIPRAESAPMGGSGSAASARPFLGPYRLLEQLGRGGMGVVYLAQHRETGQTAALKTVVGVSEGVLSSLRREIHALARLRHPGIVKILDEGVEQGLPWYAMELLEGTPLNRYRSSPAAFERQATPERPGPPGSSTAQISDPRAQPWWTQALSDPKGTGLVEVGRIEPAVQAEQQPAATALPLAGRGQLAAVLRLVRRLCSALAYLHGEGLVHRDLKPANILVQQGDWPILVDFGLMTRFSASEASREVLDVSDLSAGTATYIAPEQARGEFVDARADLYALGCILYQLVCGRPPFIDSEPMRIISQHLFTPPKPPSQLARGVPPELDALILKLLAKDPRNRLGYATDVALVLEKLGAGEESWSDELPPPRSYLYRPGFGGRQDELEVLAQQLGRVRTGPGGERVESGSPVVLVGGESGIGKTRLAMEFAREAAKENVQVLVGECLPTTSGEQRAASGEQRPSSGDLLPASGEQEARFGHVPSSSLAARSSQLASSSLTAPSPLGARGSPLAAPLHPLRRPLQQIADRCREKGLAETERLLGAKGKVLSVYAPALEGLPGQELHPAPAELLPSAARLRLYNCLTDTFATLAESQPLLLVLDDLQWADELTLGFVEHFLHHGRGKNLMLLATYRSEEVSGALGELCVNPEAVKLDLRRFDEATVAAMMADMLALSSTPKAFSQHLARQSEGNAFFVAEYLRATVGEGLLWRDHQGAWQVAETSGSVASESRLRDAATPEAAAPAPASLDAVYARLPLPASLRELVGRRLEALSRPAVQVVQAAAVLGREVDDGLLAPMTGLEDTPAMDAMGELVARQVLEQDAAGRLRFVHDKIREVAYERIASASLPALHRAAAVAMDAQPEAERKRHLAALGHHWEQAGEVRRARRAYLDGAVAARSDAALSEAERLYRAHLRLAAEPDAQSVKALNELGYEVLQPQGRNEEAREMYEMALATSKALGLRQSEAEALGKLGTLHLRTRDPAEAYRLFEKSLAIYRELGEPLGIGNILDGLATAKWRLNARDEALSLYREALAVALQNGNLVQEGITHCNLAALERSLGHGTEARAHFERGLTLLRQTGETRFEASGLGNFGSFLRAEGKTREAEAVLRRAIELLQAIGDRRNEALSTNGLGVVLEAQGRASEARFLFERSLGFGREAGELRLCILNLYGLSRLALADGAVTEAEALLEEGLSHARSLGTQTFEVEGLVYLARLRRLASADLVAADSLVQRAESLAPDLREVIPRFLLCRERAYGLLAAGRSAEEPLQRAHELARSLNIKAESDVAEMLAGIERTQAAFVAGERDRLFRGELRDDLPAGLRRVLDLRE